jgi:hypothetical protein
MEIKVEDIEPTEFEGQYKFWLALAKGDAKRSNTVLVVHDVIHDGNIHYIHYSFQEKY